MSDPNTPPTPGVPPAGAIQVLIGDYPHTSALKALAGQPDCPYQFTESRPVNAAFKRVVRDIAFDIAELSIVTFLQAREAGRPLSLIPATLFSRFQHRYLVHDTRRGPLTPADLPGRTIGCRLYSATTAAWLRGILQSEYGVDPWQINWLAFQTPHVAEAPDPAYVRLLSPGEDLLDLLRTGAVDAVIVDPLPDDPLIRPVIADPDRAAEAWYARHQSLQINHMLVVADRFSRARPQELRAFYQRLSAAKAAAGTAAGGPDPVPFGIAATRRSLEVAIEMTHRQGMIRDRVTVDSLFDPVTAEFV